MNRKNLFRIIPATLCLCLLMNANVMNLPGARGGKAGLVFAQSKNKAANSDRLIAYYKKSVEWCGTAEFKKLKAKQDLKSVLEKLVDIARSVGYDGKDPNAINKQIKKDHKAFKKDPQVKEWDKKFQQAMK